MDDNDKTKAQLVAELAQMQKRIDVLEESEIERKEAKKMLEQAHANTKNILEHTKVGVVVVGRDKKIRWVNESARKMAGVENA